MTNFLKVLHSFNAGDLITILPGLKKTHENTGAKTIIYQRLDLPAHYYPNATHSTLDRHGQGVCMNIHIYKMLYPLLLAQEYIEDFVIWEGEEVDMHYDLTRDTVSANPSMGSLHHNPSLVFPEMVGDYSSEWITVDAPTKSDYVIVNRTERYQNPYISYYFLKKYQDRLMFAGTQAECDFFCENWKLSIPRLLISNFLELAQAIKGAHGFLGNQSFCWHLSDSIKIDRILEICNQFPNTWPTSSNGYCFTRQAALEFYINKMMQ